MGCRGCRTARFVMNSQLVTAGYPEIVFLTKSSKLYAMKAKPFIKWVGGKSQLIEQLEAKLPADFDNWENVTYIEPFVGGGAKIL